MRQVDEKYEKRHVKIMPKFGAVQKKEGKFKESFKPWATKGQFWGQSRGKGG